jgi:hypothetical protein
MAPGLFVSMTHNFGIFDPHRPHSGVVYVGCGASVLLGILLIAAGAALWGWDRRYKLIAVTLEVWAAIGLVGALPKSMEETGYGPYAPVLDRYSYRPDTSIFEVAVCYLLIALPSVVVLILGVLLHKEQKKRDLAGVPKTQEPRLLEKDEPSGPTLFSVSDSGSRAQAAGKEEARGASTNVRDKVADHVRITCPKCGAKGRIPQDRVNTNIVCPRCRHRWLLAPPQ